MKKKAQSLIEYALILALVTLIAITALSMLSRKLGESEDNYQPPQNIENRVGE